MKRHLCMTALSAIVLIPDWSSACWPPGGQSAPQFYAPVYYAAPPVYYATPIYGTPVYVQPRIPMAQPVYHPPRIEPERPKAGSSLTDPPRPIARPVPAKPPVVEAIRPVVGTEVPSVRPEPAPGEPKRGGLFEIPKTLTPDTKLPPLELPKPTPPKLDFPTPEPQKGPNNDMKLPPLDLPTAPGAGAKLPSLELPDAAVPVPAPAPDTLIPKDSNSLPPLSLPPDSVIPPSKATEVKSSPLGTAARELKVSVFPAAGAAAANGFRKVGFYNHTDRDLALTIEGKPVALPAMSYLHAQLPPTFTWKCADRPAAQATVPADASGVDVLIRE